MFYKNLVRNEYDHREDFPWVSLCGIERNYVTCSYEPIVFVRVEDNNKLTYGMHTVGLFVEPFDRKLIHVDEESGCVYYPTGWKENKPQRGLLRSQLCEELFNKSGGGASWSGRER
jgi:hypothetical protein